MIPGFGGVQPFSKMMHFTMNPGDSGFSVVRFSPKFFIFTVIPGDSGFWGGSIRGLSVAYPIVMLSFSDL